MMDMDLEISLGRISASLRDGTLLTAVLDGTISCQKAGETRTLLNQLVIRAHADGDRELAVMARVVSEECVNICRLEIQEHWTQPPFGGDMYAECPACLYVYLDSESCPNGCKKSNFTWNLSTAPGDVMFLCNRGSFEAATIIAASYYESLLSSFLLRVTGTENQAGIPGRPGLLCAPHLAEKLNNDELGLGNEARDKLDKACVGCKKCGLLRNDRNKVTETDLFGTPENRRGRGHREKEGCRDVFKVDLLTMIGSLKSFDVPDFVSLRENIMDRRHLYVHRVPFWLSVIQHKEPLAYQFVGAAARFMCLCYDIFRELQNEYVAKEAKKLIDAADGVRKSLAARNR